LMTMCICVVMCSECSQLVALHTLKFVSCIAENLHVNFMDGDVLTSNNSPLFVNDASIVLYTRAFPPLRTLSAAHT
jgi:hypothetical protein